jgi:hypothetical protein
MLNHYDPLEIKLKVKLILISSRRIDQRDVDQYDARGKFNIRHSYRDDTMSARYSNHLAREGMNRNIAKPCL